MHVLLNDDRVARVKGVRTLHLPRRPPICVRTVRSFCVHLRMNVQSIYHALIYILPFNLIKCRYTSDMHILLSNEWVARVKGVHPAP